MGLHLKPRDDQFFTYFDESSSTICEGAKILKDFIDSGGDPDLKLELMERVEQKGDQVFSVIVDRLNHSFAAPFEREDIYVLARELNGISDYIHGIMEMMVLYKASSKDERIKNLAEVLEKAAEEIRSAVMGLKSLRTNFKQVIESCENIRNYEQEGDFLYRTGIALLFENLDNAVEIIKWKEIFEHLETALDHCEDVSNIVKGVAVKYV